MTDTSSRSEVFCKKCVLRNFVKPTGKHLSQSLFFNKVAGLNPCSSISHFHTPWKRQKTYGFTIALKLTYSKNKLYKSLDYWSRDILNFDFLEKSLGIVSPPYFLYDFSTKMFLMLYSINWPNFIVWSPLLLEILGNVCTAIVCYQVVTS